jgi:hypothetical protein
VGIKHKWYVSYNNNTNSVGAVGIGSYASPQNSPASVDMTGVLAGKTISSILSTMGGFMVLTNNGLVYVWGENSGGMP